MCLSLASPSLVSRVGRIVTMSLFAFSPIFLLFVQDISALLPSFLSSFSFSLPQFYSPDDRERGPCSPFISFISFVALLYAFAVLFPLPYHFHCQFRHITHFFFFEKIIPLTYHCCYNNQRAYTLKELVTTQNIRCAFSWV